MNNLSFEYPAWFLILCATAGFVVAFVLYFREQQFREQPRGLIWGMGILRWLGYSLLAALLLSPLLRYVDRDQQEPVVVLAQDVSESVGMEIDTTEYRAQWTALRDALAEKYQVVEYTFGQSFRTDGDLQFTDKRTNLDAVLTEISDVYGTQNLGAVVLATDGIYNEGTNPAYRDLQIKAPIYTVGLGDTSQRRDLLVRRVFHNKIAYLDDRFSIQVDVSARGATGSSTRLTVSRVGEGGKVLFSENISIQGDDFFTTKEVVLTADRPGVQRYRIALTGIADEVSTANNRRDIFVDVLDARQKILVLADAPHPDLSAFKQALATGKNNEVEVAYAGKFSGKVGDYDLVILHQLPSAKNPVAGLLMQLGTNKTPTLFVMGERAPAAAFNAAQDLITYRGTAGASGNEVGGRLVAGFNLFTLSDELKQSINSYPPLTAPFGEFTPGPGATQLLQQRIGRVDTEFPLVTIGESRGVRTGVIAASGLWQWRLFDFLENGTHERFDELISQLSQYLTVQEDKRRFRVNLAENIFDENEPVRLDAELYNSNYELINDAEATVTITGDDGREFEFAFTRTSNAYTLDAGILPVGNYRFRARTNTGNEDLTYDGRFSVQAVEVERYALEADHGLLRQLSERYGGELIFPAQLVDLPARLEAAGTVKPILLDTVNTRSVIHLKWIFFVLLTLYAAEWFMRRYFGGY
ncbi:hypothetical protein [Neolewinella antarctica]|uniref:Fructose-specific phosphotransferase system component IIB n=1 Tax=Neolewinella antarctica TaxID=442734 RepID=A0ABX0XCI7_9BACT|nr:hypothetical protein [Neolewinella antarctica]NJC26907.1 fructose-specific phosphotransferase system component IIB [Neolewinella antarctica]